MAPTGFMNGNRFLDQVYSLGIEIEEGTKIYLLGKLMLKADSIEKCKYEDAFQFDS